MLENENHFIAKLHQHINYAFQPIVDIHTGNTYGYEALLRGHRELGFNTIQELFDYAWQKEIMHQADVILRHKALKDFAALPNAAELHVFFNMDGRVFESPDYHPDKTAKLLASHNLPRDSFCLELSEMYNNSEAKHIEDILTRCRQQNFRLALDDYGRGFSELKMMYDHQPDYLKIDRFFVDGLAEDHKKRLLVANMINMAHALGIVVIAEGVERVEDFHLCRELGCDLAQGYLISRPQLEHRHLRLHYPIVAKLNAENRRYKKQSKSMIEDHLEHHHVIREDDKVEDILPLFKDNPEITFFPVIDGKGEGRGILRESVLKHFIYNRFGHALLHNKGLGLHVGEFTTRCPIADFTHSLDEILHIYASNDIPEGIMISRNFKYYGFLNNHSLLQIINEKRLVQAQDQNPLTKLPGNNSISDFLAQAITGDHSSTHGLVYFDFNNFKPFNDHYGFRQGDRAILLFAEILKKKLQPMNCFLAHVGGDDFFAGFKDTSATTIQRLINQVRQTFRHEVESFYAKEDREKGYILSKDREGFFKKFPILDSSAAILMLPEHVNAQQADLIGEKLAYLKKQSKQLESGLAYEAFAGYEENTDKKISA